MELTVEQAVISFLFLTLQGFAVFVMRAIWDENKELKKKLDISNEASRDLIAIQAQSLRDRGVHVAPSPERR